MINLKFTLDECLTKHSESVFVVGSTKELGQWNTN